MKRLISVFIIVVLMMITCVSYSEDDKTEIYVLCHPDSYVNVRSYPGRKGEVLGRLEVGYQLYTDNVIKNGYIHCVDMSLEDTEGWIYKGYIIYDEPVEINTDTNVLKNKVIARKYVDGDKRCYVKKDDILTVYWSGYEWSITSKGYIRTDLLNIDYSE